MLLLNFRLATVISSTLGRAQSSTVMRERKWVDYINTIEVLDGVKRNFVRQGDGEQCARITRSDGMRQGLGNSTETTSADNGADMGRC